MGGLESSAVAEGVGGFVVLSIACWVDRFFFCVCERFIEHHRCLLSSPEGRAVCRPSALAALTCLGPAAPVAPTQPGIRMTTTLMTFQSSTSF